MRRSAAFILFVAFILATITTASPLTINLEYLGGTATFYSVGGGNLNDIVRAAADSWEKAIPDDFTLTLYYGYASQGPFGLHTLLAQENGRETVGRITFSSDFPFTVFMDSTPAESSEYSACWETSRDFGAGPINDGRRCGDQNTYLSAYGVETFDLYSTVLHEIGHALGLSQTNTAFISEATDGFINITSGIYTGSALPMAFNIYGPTGHFEYPTGSVWAAMTDIVSNERNQLSDIDILAVSQVSKFTTFGMNQSTVPIIIDIQSITKKARTITVTILSSTDFEPTSEIDRATMTFGSTGTEAGSPTCVRKQKDANGDTKLDLACKFAVTKDLGLVCGINEGILKGKMVDGTPFEGSHTFSVRGCQ